MNKGPHLAEANEAIEELQGKKGVQRFINKWTYSDTGEIKEEEMSVNDWHDMMEEAEHLGGLLNTIAETGVIMKTILFEEGEG